MNEIETNAKALAHAGESPEFKQDASGVLPVASCCALDFTPATDDEALKAYRWMEKHFMDGKQLQVTSSDGAVRIHLEGSNILFVIIERNLANIIANYRETVELSH